VRLFYAVRCGDRFVDAVQAFTPNALTHLAPSPAGKLLRKLFSSVCGVFNGSGFFLSYFYQHEQPPAANRLRTARRQEFGEGSEENARKSNRKSRSSASSNFRFRVEREVPAGAT